MKGISEPPHCVLRLAVGAMSLRYRLSVLVAVALAPPLAITAYNTANWQTFLERESRDEALAAARLVAAEFSQIVEGTRQTMLAMGAHPAVPDNEEECRSYFKTVIAALPTLLAGRGGRSRRQIPLLDRCDPADARHPRPAVFCRPDENRRTDHRQAGARAASPANARCTLRCRCRRRTASIAGSSCMILNPRTCRAGARGTAMALEPPGHRARPRRRAGDDHSAVRRDERARRSGARCFEAASTLPSGTTTASDANGRAQIVGFAPVDDSLRKACSWRSASTAQMALAEVVRTAGRSIPVRDCSRSSSPWARLRSRRNT